MALLYDAYGREIYEGGVTGDAIRDAIQAAALANDYHLANEIAERYGWDNICRKCAIELVAGRIAVFQNRVHDEEIWEEVPVCKACEEALQPKFSGMKSYLHGLLHRDVQ